MSPRDRTLRNFESFYNREYPGVVHLVAALTGSRWRAEEVAQEAFMRAHERWDEIQTMDSPIGWIRRVALNLAYSSLRRMAAEVRALRRIHPDEHAEAPALHYTNFWAEVRRLPRRQAQAIGLFYVNELSVDEVAATMGVSSGTVKALLYSGRQRLRRQLVAKGWEIE